MKLKKRVRQQRAQTTFTIRTARGNQQYHCARKPQEISEFRKSLELNPSKEPESIIRVGDWVWVQYVTEGGEVDNNLALAVAILRYESGSFAVALLWGKITKAGWDGGPQRVVCTNDCQVVDKESIGGRVIESEECGRILTENSVGAKFSLDRYHISSDSYENLERLESVSFETESGQLSKRFLQEVTLAEGSPMDVQSPVQPSLLRGISEQEQLEVRDGNTTKELGPKKQDPATGTPSRLEPPPGSTSKSRPSPVKDGVPVVGADVDAGEKKDSDAGGQAASETDAETDVDEQDMAHITANTEAVAKTDGTVLTRSGIETDTETGVRSDFWAIVDVGGKGKTRVNTGPDADQDAVADGEADGEADGKVRAESAADTEADTEADTDTDAVTNIERETEVETKLEPGAGSETDIHADTEPKRAGNTGSHTKAVADCGAAPRAEYTTLAAGVPRTNGENVGAVCAGERSSARGKRIYNDTSNDDQPPKRAKVAGSPAMLASGEKTPSKAYLTNESAIESHDLQNSQPLSTPDEGRAVDERREDVLHARHKLQRMFLQKSSAPSERDVSAAGKLLTWLELRPDLEWDLMRETKIYKALGKVRNLSSIPGERGDALRRRCAALLDVWERRKSPDSGTPATTDQESMTHSEVADDGNASKSENGHDMGEVQTTSVDDLTQS